MFWYLVIFLLSKHITPVRLRASECDSKGQGCSLIHVVFARPWTENYSTSSDSYITWFSIALNLSPEHHKIHVLGPPKRGHNQVFEAYWTPRNLPVYVGLVHYNFETAFLLVNEFSSQLPGNGFYEDIGSTYVDLIFLRTRNSQAKIQLSDRHKNIQWGSWRVNLLNILGAQ